jgi:hypothetical protein
MGTQMKSNVTTVMALIRQGSIKPETTLGQSAPGRTDWAVMAHVDEIEPAAIRLSCLSRSCEEAPKRSQGEIGDPSFKDPAEYIMMTHYEYEKSGN